MMMAPKTPEECSEYYKKIGDGIKMVFSEERRHRASEAHKGKKLSDETKRKISESQKGKFVSVETRANLSAAQKKRFENPEARKKQSESSKKVWANPELRAKVSAGRRGKHHTEESKRKMSESKRKISESNKVKHQSQPRSKKPLREPTPEELAWFFFNNCRAAKRYPKQKFGVARVYRPGRTVCCSVCGEVTTSYGTHFASIIQGDPIGSAVSFVCRHCREEELEIIMKQDIAETRKKSAILASKFKSELENCKKLGTCDIIHAHHEALIEDKERLTSEFMIKMICGDAKVERYKDLAGVS